jgi:hypothetical protein
MKNLDIKFLFAFVQIIKIPFICVQYNRIQACPSKYLSFVIEFFLFGNKKIDFLMIDFFFGMIGYFNSRFINKMTTVKEVGDKFEICF